jgi:hypothetical protein
LSSWQKARRRGQKYDDLVLSEKLLHALSDSCICFHFHKKAGAFNPLFARVGRLEWPLAAKPVLRKFMCLPRLAATEEKSVFSYKFSS